MEGSGNGVTDDATFDAFYRAEYRRVLAFAATLCRDDDAAQDVAQDAFLAAQRRWESVRDFDRPDLWVRRVVANRAVSRWRKLVNDERRVQRLVELRPEVQHQSPNDGFDLWALVRGLPPRQAQVIALTYLEDRPLDEVARVLAIGTETAKTHLQRARAALARALETIEREDVE
jgi:RNA polymerase sigma-70 factor (ECF subfamily)